MQGAVDENRLPLVCRRDILHTGGYHLVLWRHQALSAQGCECFSHCCYYLLTIQAALRQMVYLVIKELSKIAEDVIMVTSSIMKDMQPNLEVIYRPNAIRALARIIDVRDTTPK
jgi:hypothetical protein